MAIAKSMKVSEILDHLAVQDVTVREALVDVLPSDDVDEFTLSLLPSVLLNRLLERLRAGEQAHVA